MTIYLTSGLPCEKVTADEMKITVVPHVAMVPFGRDLVPAIGFSQHKGEGAHFFVIPAPLRLIQAWRALKLFEQVPVIGDSTLASCWAVAESKPQIGNRHYVQEIADEFDDVQTFEHVWANILNMLPNAKEYDTLLHAAYEQDIDVQISELDLLIQSNRLPPHYLVAKLAKRAKLLRECNRIHEQIRAQPLPKYESLGYFFYQMEVPSLISGNPNGVFEEDWWYINHEELDERIRDYIEEGVQAELPLYIPNNDLGIVVGPYIVLDDGTKITFIGATYHDNSIILRAIFAFAGDEPFEKLLPVSFLRLALGLPSAPANPLEQNTDRAKVAVYNVHPLSLIRAHSDIVKRTALPATAIGALFSAAALYSMFKRRNK